MMLLILLLQLIEAAGMGILLYKTLSQKTEQTPGCTAAAGDELARLNRLLLDIESYDGTPRGVHSGHRGGGR